jgi:transketolase
MMKSVAQPDELRVNMYMDLPGLELKARQVRATCIQMAFDGKHGHLGSALSCTDLLVTLYCRFLKLSPEDPGRSDRDRFIFSKGHACTSLYAVLADRGFIPKSWLAEYAWSDAPLAVHPCKHALPLLECSSGSLGHGLGIATGILYGHRLDRMETRAVVLMSDGECNEGSVWESAMFAAANKLDRLLAIVDYNGIQAVGRSDEIMGFTDLAEKFRAFGWGAVTINGNDIGQIIQALESFPFEPGRPSAIVARTKKGAGVPFMEDSVLWHYRVPSERELAEALRILAVPPLHKEEC